MLVGRGRDYGDVPPIKGIVAGHGPHHVSTSRSSHPTGVTVLESLRVGIHLVRVRTTTAVTDIERTRLHERH